MAEHDDDAPNWGEIAKMDPVVHAMLGAGMPMTRENYISTNWGEPGTMDYPKEWTQEHEDMLPEPFQRK
jgi:hypothetical protein